MAILFFIAYLIFSSWVLTRLGFVRRSGLGNGFILFVYLLKVGAGLAYGYLHAKAPEHVGLTDTWKFFSQGADQTLLLKQDPAEFFRDLLPKEVHAGFRGFFSTSNSYWNDIKHETMVKLASVLNLFSNSNYYINIIGYNFLVFPGGVALYRGIRQYVANDVVAKGVAFFVPSTVFWTSGFHKEGLVFTALAMIFYLLVRMYRNEKLHLSHLIAGGISMITLLLLRNNLLLPLIPAALAFLLCMKLNLRPRYAFGIVLGISLLLFFLSPRLGMDLPYSVSQRQHEFAALGGRTAVDVPPLRPEPGGFLRNLPWAVDLGFLRPHVFDGGKKYVPFTLEITVLLMLILFAILKGKKPAAPGIAMFLVTFSVLAILMIGFTVPNIGALIRYRSVALPFLFSGLVMLAPIRELNKKLF